MKCNECEGTGKTKLYNDWKIEAGESLCGKCKGSGELTKHQELEYNLKNMLIHEELKVDDNCFVLRVLNGWVYSYYSSVSGDITSSVFVKDLTC